MKRGAFIPVWQRLAVLVALMLGLVLAGTIAWQSRVNRANAIEQVATVAVGRFDEQRYVPRACVTNHQ